MVLRYSQCYSTSEYSNNISQGWWKTIISADLRFNYPSYNFLFLSHRSCLMSGSCWDGLLLCEGRGGQDLTLRGKLKTVPLQIPCGDTALPSLWTWLETYFFIPAQWNQDKHLMTKISIVSPCFCHISPPIVTDAPSPLFSAPPKVCLSALWPQGASAPPFFPHMHHAFKPCPQCWSRSFIHHWHE